VGDTSRMIRFEMLSGLVVLGLWIFCLVEVIGTDDAVIRNLPKVGWLLIVLFFPLAGSVAWLVAGRPVATAPARYDRAVADFSEYDRPGRAAAIDPAADEDFLRRVRERAEEQRRSYRESRRAENGTGPGPNRDDPGSEPPV
jgi:hypothetical protein